MDWCSDTNYSLDMATEELESDVLSSDDDESPLQDMAL